MAATAEVLTTIVNTVGWEREVVLGGRDDDHRRAGRRGDRGGDDPLGSVLGGLLGDRDGRGRRRGHRDDDPIQRNIGAAAQEELRHYDVLVALGAKAITKRIWVPDAVFASRENLLNTLVVGDQIFINAYLIGVGAFAKADPKLAAVPAEFMGAEAVHRALALQSLGELGNDRIFMKVEFFDILEAVSRLKAAGFGFGEKGAEPGGYFDFDTVRRRTPTDPDVNTPDVTPIDA